MKTRLSAVARLAAVALAVSMLGATACDGEAQPRPVTEAEADRLSEVLFHLWDEGGMTFTLDAQPQPGQQTHIEGSIDYRTGIGYGVVTATGADAPVTAVIFTDTIVLESIPALTDIAPTLGLDGLTWVTRPLDSTVYDLDGLLMLLAGLGAEQRDNPALILQGGTTWLRSDELRGTAVDVFEYSEQARFWVESGTATLVRFEGNNTALNRPIVIDVYSLGTPEEPTIDESTVVDADQLGDLYAAYRTAASS